MTMQRKPPIDIAYLVKIEALRCRQNGYEIAGIVIPLQYKSALLAALKRQIMIKDPDYKFDDKTHPNTLLFDGVPLYLSEVNQIEPLFYV